MAVPCVTVTLGLTDRRCAALCVPSAIRRATMSPLRRGVIVALYAPDASVTADAARTPASATATSWPATAGVTTPETVTVSPKTTVAGESAQLTVVAGDGSGDGHGDGDDEAEATAAGRSVAHSAKRTAAASRPGRRRGLAAVWRMDRLLLSRLGAWLDVRRG